MKIFDWLKANKKGNVFVNMEETPSIEDENYAVLIDIAKILTDNDSAAIEGITLLVNDLEQFKKLYPTWDDELAIDIIAVYWLTGYDSPCDFGAFIDWKEETNEIIWSLEPSIQNKGYQIDFKDINFSGEEFTDKALFKMNEYLNERGFTLCYWDTDSDCYHLFIIPTAKWTELVKLGEKCTIEFKNDY